MPAVPAAGATPRRNGKRRVPTALALVGVILSTAILTLVLSITHGQDRLLRTSLRQVSAHMTVTPARTTQQAPRRLFNVPNGVIELVVNTPPTDRREIKPLVEVATRARRSSRLIESVAPFVMLHGVYRNGARYRAVEVRGVDPSSERGVGRDPRRSRSLIQKLRTAPEGTVIGRGLARTLGARVGDRLTLVTATGVVQKLSVVGVFESDVLSIANERAYINLALAQSLHGMPRNAMSGLAITAKRPDDARRAATAVERAIGYRTLTWEQANDDALSQHRTRIVATWIAAGALVLVAAMAMANAQLAALLFPATPHAASPRDAAFSTLIVQGMRLGAVGGVIGVGIGMLASLLIVRSGYVAPSFLSALLHMRRTPSSFDPVVFVAPAVIAFVLVTAASLIPALRARRRARTYVAPSPVSP